MLQKRLRYADLVALGLFRNRQSLKNAINRYGFPAGQRLGDNTRVWIESEVQAWLNARPVEPKAATPSTRRRGRPRKTERQQASAP
jgi:hypothetical protein